MTLLHLELVKFVDVQKERVARTDNERRAMGFYLHSRRFEPKNLSPEQQTDLSFQLKYLSHYWHSHLQNYRLDPELLDVVTCALMYRNKVSHQSQMSLAEYNEAIATFERLADTIGCNALVTHRGTDNTSRPP
ncbi:hypothetical protein DVH05_007537 [Phytophthora capsici]|nr:hypothetical protein DVH05_025895 [Phytophthora capsici]KAG1703593.1 hypothetical protein DVH05_007537 [Phytophthora capsici]